MPDQKVLITCPHCDQQFSPDDALSHRFEEKYEQEFSKKLEEEKKRLELEQQQEKARLWKVAQEKANEKLKAEVAEESRLIKEELEEKTKKLEEARLAELELRKQKNLLEEERRTFELEKQRQLDEEREKIRQAVASQMLEEHRLKDAEKERKLLEVMKMNEDLRLKLQQGSQQSQGETLELELEELLRQEFPYDEIVPVAKGVNGADVIQRVRDTAGRECGTIIWESKNTKNWSPGWIGKLKDDQRAQKAEVAVLISSVLPQDITTFGFKEGIYVTRYDCLTSLAKLLRMTLIDITVTKLSVVGKNEKMEVVYNYLTSPAFTQRVDAIREAFTTMREDLDKEKRAFTQIWAKREKQIDRVIDNTIGMRGDLQGIIGSAMPALPELDLETIALENRVEEVN